MQIVNLTQHPIVIVGGPTVAPSGSVARCATVSVPAGNFGGVPLTKTQYGAVEGLPDPVDGVLYVVSAMVRAAVPDRHDVASPGNQVRDANGAIIGCRSLDVNG